MENSLPKIVWMYWEQGLDNAPEVVKQCHASWRRLNPDWQVVMLDKNSMPDYVDLPAIIGSNYDNIPVQHRSDMLRLNLLARFGGVWADATCLCNWPLDSWMHECIKSGFFVFRDPGRDRLISNWFITSLPENHLTASFCEAHNSYWRTHSFPNPKTRFRKHLVRMVRAMLGKRVERQDYWLSFPVRRLLRIYPYFIFHYHFAYHIRRDRFSREIFERMPYFAAEPAKALRKRMLRDMGQSVESQGNAEGSPISKLTWKKPLPEWNMKFRGGGDASTSNNKRG
jgi:hypothetical protein